MQKRKPFDVALRPDTYKAAQLWELLPYDIKDFQTLIEFKDRIKTWSSDNCLCCLCKTYLKNFGY